MKSSIISVIIPAYDSEKTIGEAIESVLSQTFSDLELIIINDGSTDSTLEIISSFEDSRIRIFSFENAGGNVSRNRGLHLAVGEFISFLDADDIWTPDKLESQLKALQENLEAMVAYSWTDYINDDAEKTLSGQRVNLSGNVIRELLLTNFLENGSNPLMYRDAIASLGGFDESLPAAQDWDMWLRLAAKFDFVCVPSVQILYRISPNSVSSNLRLQEKCCLRVLRRGYDELPNALKSKQDWNKGLSNLYKFLTCKALQEPFSRYRAMLAFWFLCKYFISDSERVDNKILTLKLLRKIIVMLLSPSLLRTLLGLKLISQLIPND